MALHGTRDIADHDELARAPHRPTPDPVEDVAAGGQAAPEHDPGSNGPTVVVELAAPGPAALQVGQELVDQALGVAQLGRAHPVELLVAIHLALAIGQLGHGQAVERAIFVDVLAVVDRARRALRGGLAGLLGLRFFAGAGRLVLRAGFVARRLGRQRTILVGQTRPARSPEPLEDHVVDLDLVAAPDEDGFAGRPDLLAVAQLDDTQGPAEIDRGTQVGGQPGQPELAGEADRPTQEASAIDGRAPGQAGRRQGHDPRRCARDRRGSGGGHGRLAAATRRGRAPRASGGRLRPGSRGRPLHT